jgi:hypothetical protein
MTNSDQDNNEPQPTPEVEDPITNPGKKEPVTTAESTSAEATASEPVKVTKPASNGKLMVSIGIVGLLVVSYMFMTGGTGEGGAQNTGSMENSGQTQTNDGGTAGGETPTGDESNNSGESTEGGEGLPVAEDATPATNSEGAGNEDRVLDSIDLQTDIAVSNNEELLAEVTDMLVLSDRLGPNDELSISTEGEVNGNRIIRMEQTHLGIPVFGSGVVAIESNGTVINISGSTGNDIEINVEPGLSYEEALEIANQDLSISVSPRAEAVEAQLLIVDIEGTYHLGWYSVVVIDGLEERIILDAQDGMILLRLPVNIGEA